MLFLVLQGCPERNTKMKCPREDKARSTLAACARLFHSTRSRDININGKEEKANESDILSALPSKVGKMKVVKNAI